MNIGIFANLAKPAAEATLADLAAAARDLRVSLVACDKETARLAPGAKLVAPSRFGKSVDMLLSLGGDGTVLQSVRALNGADAPILGINLGNLGFLTSVPDTHAVDALRALASGAYEVTAYPLLDARLFRGPRRKRIAVARALNDVVMGWGTSPRATMIEIEVDHQPVASFVCDGLIVATPIGSTGHALSAGGPILHRETPAIVLEPICPHTLSNRTVVLPNNRLVSLRVADRRKKLLLSVDGQSHGWLEHGDLLEIRKAPESARFVHLPGYSWFKLLTQKLHWRGSSADPK
jgi:NAD+ kinase